MSLAAQRELQSFAHRGVVLDQQDHRHEIHYRRMTTLAPVL